MAEKSKKPRPRLRPAASEARSGAAGPDEPAGGEADSRNALARVSGVALWRQIVLDIEADIRTGRLQPGDRLPTETALAEKYGVNRHTLRRSLAELARRGLVKATPRLGTYVSQDRIPYALSETTRFSELVTRAGREPGGRLISARECEPPGQVSDWLVVSKRAKVLEMEHVRDANQLPICVATMWFPADRLPRIAEYYERTSSITKALALHGVKDYRRKWTKVTARVADSAERSLLEIAPGAIVLVAESLSTDLDGEPVMAASTRFVAERVELIVETPGSDGGEGKPRAAQPPSGKR